MGLILLVVWWLFGVLGGLLLWRNWKLEFPDEVGRCPTRKGALGIAVYGVLGPIGLGAGLVVTFIYWLDHGFKSHRFNRINNWLNKPIC
jgi:hypothetical protein